LGRQLEHDRPAQGYEAAAPDHRRAFPKPEGQRCRHANFLDLTVIANGDSRDFTDLSTFLGKDGGANQLGRRFGAWLGWLLR
jgi:hypothetical protein